MHEHALHLGAMERIRFRRELQLRRADEPVALHCAEQEAFARSHVSEDATPI